jgi:hypothetical protein
MSLPARARAGENRTSSVPGLKLSPSIAIRFSSRFHSASVIFDTAASTASSFRCLTSRKRGNGYPSRSESRSSAATSLGKQ